MNVILLKRLFSTIFGKVRNIKKKKKNAKKLEKIGINPAHCEDYSGILNYVEIYPEKGNFSDKGGSGIATIVVFYREWPQQFLSAFICFSSKRR